MNSIILFLLSVVIATDIQPSISTRFYDTPVTEGTLSETLKNITKDLKAEVQKIITASETQNLATLQETIRNNRLLEDQSNEKMFKELQEMIRKLSSTSVTSSTKKVDALANLVPIFLKLQKCGSCYSCARGEVCLYLLILHVLPLITEGDSGAQSDTNVLVRTLTSALTGQRGGIPSLQHNGHTNDSLLQTLISLVFRDQVTGGCGTYPQPTYGPTPVVQPTYGPTPLPQPAYGPAPVVQPTYGPTPLPQPTYGPTPLPQPTYKPCSYSSACPISTGQVDSRETPKFGLRN